MERLLTALIVDPNEARRRQYAHELNTVGFEVLAAEDGESARAMLLADGADLVVTNLELPEGGCGGLLRSIRTEAQSWVPVIVIARRSDACILPLVLEAGQYAANRLLDADSAALELAVVARDLVSSNVQQVREQRKRVHFVEILRALRECSGVIAHMAERMGTNRQTVYYHLKQFGLYDAKEPLGGSAAGMASTRPDARAAEPDRAA